MGGEPFPDYQLDHERERCLQAAEVARRLESLVLESPGHVIVAGDMDADETADSMRFWAGRLVVGDLSLCYRSAWESARPGEPLMTFTPRNPNSADPDWPFRGIDHVLIRCGSAGHRCRFAVAAESSTTARPAPATTTGWWSSSVRHDPEVAAAFCRDLHQPGS